MNKIEKWHHGAFIEKIDFEKLPETISKYRVKNLVRGKTSASNFKDLFESMDVDFETILNEISILENEEEKNEYVYDTFMNLLPKKYPINDLKEDIDKLKYYNELLFRIDPDIHDKNDFIDELENKIGTTKTSWEKEKESRINTYLLELQRKQALEETRLKAESKNAIQKDEVVKKEVVENKDNNINKESENIEQIDLGENLGGEFSFNQEDFKFDSKENDMDSTKLTEPKNFANSEELNIESKEVIDNIKESNDKPVDNTNKEKVVEVEVIKEVEKKVLVEVPDKKVVKDLAKARNELDTRINELQKQLNLTRQLESQLNEKESVIENNNELISQYEEKITDLTEFKDQIEELEKIKEANETWGLSEDEFLSIESKTIPELKKIALEYEIEFKSNWVKEDYINEIAKEYSLNKPRYSLLELKELVKKTLEEYEEEYKKEVEMSGEDTRQFNFNETSNSNFDPFSNQSQNIDDPFSSSNNNDPFANMNQNIDDPFSGGSDDPFGNIDNDVDNPFGGSGSDDPFGNIENDADNPFGSGDSADPFGSVDQLDTSTQFGTQDNAFDNIPDQLQTYELNENINDPFSNVVNETYSDDLTSGNAFDPFAKNEPAKNKNKKKKGIKKFFSK